ncbi:MAG: glycosyltransferase family 39 protein [Dehalococcoidia bacterium]
MSETDGPGLNAQLTPPEERQASRWGVVIDASAARALPRPAPIATPVAGPASMAPAADAERRERGGVTAALVGVLVVSVAAAALGLRLWSLMTLGLNHAEVAIAADAVALTGAGPSAELFTRTSGGPQLLPVVLGGLFVLVGPSDLALRLLAALVGLATIGATYLVARELYGSRVGAASALLLAVMPYSVLVSRVLTADVAAALFVSLALYGLVRFTRMQRASWLLVGATFLGLAVLVRESSVLFAMPFFLTAVSSRWDRLGRGALIGSALVFGLIAAVYPVSALLAGGGRDLLLHLARQLNIASQDSWYAYLGLPAVLSGAWLLICAAVALAVAGVRPGWRGIMVSLWVLVPLAAYLAWPSRGFTFLAPLAPALAIMLARSADAVAAVISRQAPVRVAVALVAALCLVFAGSSAAALSGRVLDAAQAGVEGVVGGRNAGAWVRANVPAGGTILATNDAFGDVLQFYGERRVLVLAADPAPGSLDPQRAPTDEGAVDLLIRESGIQYLVWDVQADERDHDAAEQILALARRYHGHEVYRFESALTVDGGTSTPAVIVYEVRP